MTTYSGRTVRLALSRNVRELFGRFESYVTSSGHEYSRARIPVSDADAIVDACTLVRYELARLIGERRDGTLEVELTAAGLRAQRDVLAGAEYVTVTTRPEAPIVVNPWDEFTGESEEPARPGQAATTHDPVWRRTDALGMFVEHYDPDGALSYRLLDTPNARMRQEIDRLRRDGLTVHHYDRHTGWTGLILTRPHGMRLRHELIGEPEGPLARSRRGTETPAHTQRYQLTETDVSILERFIAIPIPNGSTICRYSVPFDQATTIQPMLNLMRLGLVNVMEVSGSHHAFELTETGHHIRDLARRNPGSPVFVAEPGAVEFKFTEEEAKPTPPQSATQPQRRLRNSRKKG